MNDSTPKQRDFESSGKQKHPGRTVLKILGGTLLLVVLAAAGMAAYLTIVEFRPLDTESVEVDGEAGKTLSEGDEFTVLTWNTGYGALGDNADFFMDGGKSVFSSDKERVKQNLSAMIEEMSRLSPDAVFLQEVDTDSDRSYHINESEYFQEAFPHREAAKACNFKAAFVPYPIPPIGKVDCGIMTLSSFHLTEAERVQLPCPFRWPVRIVNLKRCLLITRVPIEGSDRELILVNLHLEAYDDGEGKEKQTAMLRDILVKEADAGNYVIAGGDFNQTFSSTAADKYPVQEGLWSPGMIDASSFPENWQLLMDDSVPSCRSLDKAYAGADREHFQYYLIDGFIVSSDIEVKSCKGLSLDFAATDHNPVLLTAVLK